MQAAASTEHRIQVDGGTLCVVEAGAGSPLVMVHGWPLDHRMFNRQVEALATDFRCIAIDRRGFGRSTAPPDMRRELDDIDCIIDALGLDTIHLYGVSQGGRIALRYAATRPQRLRSLLLQGAVVDGLDIEEPAAERVPVAQYATLAKGGKVDTVKSRWLAHPMMQLPNGHAEEQALLDLIVADYSGADLRAFDPAHYEFDVDILASLATSAVPVLLLTGVQETDARKAHAAAICERVANCREVVFANSGHLPNLTEPGVLNEQVREFILTVDSLAA